MRRQVASKTAEPAGLCDLDETLMCMAPVNFRGRHREKVNLFAHTKSLELNMGI